MKIFKKTALVIIAVLITIGVVLCSACSLKNFKLSKIPRDGSYGFISYDYVTADGRYVYLPNAASNAVKRYLLNTKINVSTRYLVPAADGTYIAVKFYYGDDKTRYDLAIGYMKYSTLIYSIRTVIRNVDRLATTRTFDGQKFIFKSGDGDYKIFDYKTGAVEPFVHPAEMAENKFNGFLTREDKLGATYYDEEEGVFYYYLIVGGSVEKIISYQYDEDIYGYDYKEGYWFLTTGNLNGIVSAFNVESGEIISGESALELYRADAGRAVLDGEEYAFDFNDAGSLTISGGGNEKTFTMSYLRDTVPAIDQADAIYGSGTLNMYRIMEQNGELFLVLKCEMGMFGYFGMTPPLILRFNPDSFSFSYVGFHPDHTYSITSIQKI